MKAPAVCFSFFLSRPAHGIQQLAHK